MSRARRRAPSAAWCAGLMGLALLASSCAYYNTFYLARKYYNTATLRQPYLVDRPTNVDTQNFNKSVDYSKKVIGQYPKSKWVDDAYLLWARALLGKDDPRQTVAMLQDFDLHYPDSPITAEAKFYLGVAYRQDHKNTKSAKTLEEFLKMAPRHPLVPYAHLERARALQAAQDYEGAAAEAGVVLERWPRGPLQVQARTVRSECWYLAGDFDRARQDFHDLGLSARDDEERMAFLLREADCLEAAKDFDRELTLLKNAQSHEVPPIRPVTPNPAMPASPGVVQSAPPQYLQQQPGGANDRYGRLMVRIGTAHVLKGDLESGITAYRSVVRDYPRTPLAAHAQYRIGYAYETAADSFAIARAEYARVRDIAASTYVDSAQRRMENLERLAKFKSTAKDSVEAQAEAGFLLAEQYLFNINKPDRALEEYRKIEQQFTGTPWGAKAIVAQAWVLSRKLGKKAEADTLFWRVVREHPATEAQLAARDYLEMEGAQVPENLIQLPVRQLAQAAPPQEPDPAPPVPALAGTPLAPNDSLGTRPGPGALVPGAALLHGPPPQVFGPPVPGANPPPAPPPLTGPPVTAAAPRDTVSRAKSDTTSTKP